MKSKQAKDTNKKEDKAQLGKQGSNRENGRPTHSLSAKRPKSIVRRSAGNQALLRGLDHDRGLGGRKIRGLVRIEGRARNGRSMLQRQDTDPESGEQSATGGQQQINVSQIAKDFFQWAAANYIVPKDKYLQEGNWQNMGPTHKADPPSSWGDIVTGAYAEAGQNESMEAIKAAAFVMGLSMTAMIGVEIYATLGTATAAEAMLLGVKGGTRVGIHSIQALIAFLSESESAIKVIPQDTTRLQTGFFLIYIAGDSGVQDRFLDERYPDVPQDVKNAVKVLVSASVDKNVSALGAGE